MSLVMAGVIDASKMPSPLEVKRSVMAAPVEYRRLHTEHFTHPPDVTGQGTSITSHPALHNGNNCVMDWQFTGPFDSSNPLYSVGVGASLSTQQGQSDKQPNGGKTLQVNGALQLFLHNL